MNRRPFREIALEDGQVVEPVDDDEMADMKLRAEVGLADSQARRRSSANRRRKVKRLLITGAATLAAAGALELDHVKTTTSQHDNHTPHPPTLSTEMGAAGQQFGEETVSWADATPGQRALWYVRHNKVDPDSIH